MDFPIEPEDLPIEYIPGTSLDFVHAMRDLKLEKRTALSIVGGKFRWVVTREDGTKYVARPIESKDESQQDTH